MAGDIPNFGKELLAAAERMLQQAGDLRALSIVNPAEGRKIAARLEALEQNFAKFLSDTEYVVEGRKNAKEVLSATEHVVEEREIAQAAILKFATLRADMNGDKPGN